MTKYNAYSILFAFFVGLFSAGVLALPDKQEPVVVQLKWYHQFQFAGFYAAKELGYYRDAGLNVTINERDFETPVLDVVLSGKAQFGVADATLVMHRLKGLPVVALFASYQYSPLVLISRKQDNIINPVQLKHKRIMFQRNTDDSTILALFRQFDIASSDITHVPFSEPHKALLNHEVDAYSGYITNQPCQHCESGIQTNIINPANYGIDFIGDLTYTSEAYLKSHRQQVNDFRQATIRGWQYALEHPEQVIDWIIHIYHSKKSRAALIYEANVTKTLFDADLSKVGNISPQRLLKAETLYKELNVVPARSNLTGFELSFYDTAPSQDWRVITLVVLVLIILCLMLFIGRHRISAVARGLNVLFSKTALVEAKHQHMIDQNILSYRTDKNDCFIFVSPAFCQKLGYSAQELTGRARSTLYHPGFPSSIIVKISKSVMSRLSWSGEIMYQNKTGKLFWHRTQLDPIVKNEYLLGYSSIEYDISDKKRMEQPSAIDSVTGLFNRKKIEQIIHYERNRSTRTCLPFSILLLNFKGLEVMRNKEGEQAVNNMLLALANIVNHEIRISDTAGKWKADQLLIICPETTANGACILGTKIASSVESYNLSSVIALKINFAAAKLNEDEEVAELLERIEKKLA